jgi:hypothetical protein
MGIQLLFVRLKVMVQLDQQAQQLQALPAHKVFKAFKV